MGATQHRWIGKLCAAGSFFVYVKSLKPGLPPCRSRAIGEASLSWRASARSSSISFEVASRVGAAGEAFLAGFEEDLRPAAVQVPGDALVAAQLGDAVSPRRPSRTMRIFSSAEKLRRSLGGHCEPAPRRRPAGVRSYQSSSSP
jgi:hypothetical protein